MFVTLLRSFHTLGFFFFYFLIALTNDPNTTQYAAIIYIFLMLLHFTTIGKAFENLRSLSLVTIFNFAIRLGFAILVATYNNLVFFLVGEVIIGAYLAITAFVLQLRKLPANQTDRFIVMAGLGDLFNLIASKSPADNFELFLNSTRKELLSLVIRRGIVRASLYLATYPLVYNHPNLWVLCGFLIIPLVDFTYLISQVKSVLNLLSGKFALNTDVTKSK